MRRLAALAALVLAASLSAHAQRGGQAFTTGPAVLEVPFSAETAAMAGGATFLPSTDPYAPLRSPAQFASTGMAPGLYVGGYSGAPDWLPGLGADFSTSSFAAAAGQRVAGGGLAVGAGASYARFSLGEQPIVSEDNQVLGTVEAWEDAASLGAGVSTGGPLRVAGGLALRHAREHGIYPPFDEEGGGERTLTALSLDLGATATADVMALAGLDVEEASLAPALEISAGYAQRNGGPEPEQFGEGAPERRLPRTATVGWAARLGLDQRVAGGRLRVVGLELAIEADGRLELQEFDLDGPSGPMEPEGEDRRALLFGEIGPAEALLGKGNANVTGRRAGRLTLGETVWLSSGRFEGGSFDGRRASGFGVSVGGWLRLTGTFTRNAALADLGRRFDLCYTRATLNEGSDPFETRLHSVTLAWRGW